jgi:hypothetical protein
VCIIETGRGKRHHAVPPVEAAPVEAAPAEAEEQKI